MGFFHRYLNLISLLAVLAVFPLLWIFNQKVNGKQLSLLDTDFSLKSDKTLKAQDLASPFEYIDSLPKSGPYYRLDPRAVRNPVIGVLGRRFIGEGREVKDIYEYQDANHLQEDVERSKSLKGVNDGVDIESLGGEYYKNLLIISYSIGV